MKIKPVQFILVFLFVLSVCEFSLADGFYIPEVRQKLPDIPVQRALIKYRQGIETLMIESTLNGSGKNFGWVIPVPGQPLQFEKLSPGLLKTLSVQIGPSINHFRPDRGIFGVPFSISTNRGCCCSRAVKRPGPPSSPSSSVPVNNSMFRCRPTSTSFGEIIHIAQSLVGNVLSSCDIRPPMADDFSTR